MSGNELILNNGKHVFQFSGSNSEIERRIRLHHNSVQYSLR